MAVVNASAPKGVLNHLISLCDTPDLIKAKRELERAKERHGNGFCLRADEIVLMAERAKGPTLKGDSNAKAQALALIGTMYAHAVDVVAREEERRDVARLARERAQQRLAPR